MDYPVLDALSGELGRYRVFEVEKGCAWLRLTGEPSRLP